MNGDLPHFCLSGWFLKLGLHDAISQTDSFVFTPDHCVNFKTMRLELKNVGKIKTDKFHRAAHFALYLKNMLKA